MEQTIAQLQAEKAYYHKNVENIQKQVTSLDIENDTQKNHIRELEQFVMLLSQALTSGQNTTGLSQLGSMGKNHEEANLIQQFVS